MAELKTRPTNRDVTDYIASVSDPRRRKEAGQLLEMMSRATGEPAMMWGASIVGFGSYTYQNGKGQDQTWCLTAFSPRKQALSIYIMPGFDPWPDLMATLGPHRIGKSCLYVTRLDKVDFAVLEQLVSKSVALMRDRYGA